MNIIYEYSRGFLFNNSSVAYLFCNRKALIMRRSGILHFSERNKFNNFKVQHIDSMKWLPFLIMKIVLRHNVAVRDLEVKIGCKIVK